MGLRLKIVSAAWVIGFSAASVFAASTAPHKTAPSAKTTPASSKVVATGKSAHTTKAAGSSKSKHRAPKVRGQAAPTSDRISEIQTALAKSGAYKGDPSGKWDDGSVDAMKHFQQQNGLAPSGKLDAQTLQKLGLGSDIAGRSAPRPQSPAGSNSIRNL